MRLPTSLFVLLVFSIQGCSSTSPPSSGEGRSSASSSSYGESAIFSGNTTASLWIDGKPKQLAQGTWPDSKYRHYLLSAFSSKAFFPLFSTLALGGSSVHDEITRAVIWIHGLASDANTYFTDGVAVAERLAADGSTLTVAPWFGETEVLGSFWSSSLDSTLKSIYWYDDVSYAHWLLGGNSSSNVSGAPYNSFDVLDQLISQLQSASDRFPSLKSITVAGFSAGCQMSSRWAFFSDSLTISSKSRAAVQVVASDCSSYMYVDPTRPAESCRTLNNTGVGHTCSQFEKPSWTRRRYYHSYKYGLHGATRDISYSDAQLDALTTSFPSKPIRFLFGTEDACNCKVPAYENPSFCTHSTLSCSPVYGHQSTCCDTYPDTETANAVDNSSQAMLQGSNRLQRGLNYVYHLRDYYKSNTFPEFGTFEGGHDSAAFGQSEQFSSWVFGVSRGQSDRVAKLVV